MGEQGLLGISGTSSQSYDDARRAKPALAASGGTQCVRPRLRLRDAFEGGDLAPSHPHNGRYARNSWLAVDQYGAAAALTLGTATVFGRSDSEPIAQHFKKRCPIVWNFGGTTVDGE